MVAAALAACQKQETAASSAAPAAPAASAPAAVDTTAATAQPAAAPAIPPSQGKVTGKVADTFNAAGYTYLKLRTEKGEEWAAVPQMDAKKGQTLTINIQMVAEKFESKTLNRKFDRIYFGNVEGPGAPGAAPGQIAMSTPGMPPGHPATGGAAPSSATGAMGSPAQHMQAPEVGDIKVPKADGGNTVAEVWASRETLKGKDVVVRGKVVKFLSGILGKNWLHVRDGSGSKDKGDNDITVTTSATAAVGDVVVVRGKVSVDKDFGAGYRYPVIVEDAKLSK